MTILVPQVHYLLFTLEPHHYSDRQIADFQIIDKEYQVVLVFLGNSVQEREEIPILPEILVSNLADLKLILHYLERKEVGLSVDFGLLLFFQSQVTSNLSSTLDVSFSEGIEPLPP